MTTRRIHLGTQYFRPPFPRDLHWDDDFRRIKNAGLNTVQLWVLWSWVEAEPGRFDFDDYDRLVELAAKHDLQVVLSTIAEVQPQWIHREIPGSEMITNMGIKVVSSNRNECHFGLTPGGCTDHPEVWNRMRGFLEAVGQRYAGTAHLAGWDVWNELRWNVNADGRVCHCEHTLKAFRDWLKLRHGSLAGLNDAWLRRYDRWDDVLPGKKPGQPYTEMMAWQHFLTWRACEHARARYEVLKSIDPEHPVTLHGAAPSPAHGGNSDVTPLDRGNDWHFADVLDGIGCSSFPKWFNIDDADFGRRIEFVRAAARGKAIWLSELQGGRSAQGFDIHDPVDALSQQRWIWNGLACGADTILFWCWRDEVFTCEAGGYGLIGLDGLAEERIAAMQVTGRVLNEHADIMGGYAPEPGTFGVLFSPQSYYYYAAQDGHARKPQAALHGACRALVRRSIPFTVVEEEHLDVLADLKVLYLPRTTAITRDAEEALLKFVREGGVLAVESECGAFNEVGLYAYPDERFLAREAGLCEIGRRQVDCETFGARLGDMDISLGAAQWLTPLIANPALRTHASHGDGALLASRSLGRGTILYCGSYPSEAYGKDQTSGFEDYLHWIAREAGWQPDVEVLSPAPGAQSFLYVKYGSSNGRRVLFVFFPPDCDCAHLRFHAGFFTSSHLVDIISGTDHALTGSVDQPLELLMDRPAWRFAVLVESETPEP